MRSRTRVTRHRAADRGVLAFLSLVVFAIVVVDDRYWAVPNLVALIVLARASCSPTVGLAGTWFNGRPLISPMRPLWAAVASLPILPAPLEDALAHARRHHPTVSRRESRR